MTYFKIFYNIHLNIIASRKYIYLFKDVFFFFKINFFQKAMKNQWSEGARVTPYSMIGP
jgi:hypothetical protein